MSTENAEAKTMTCPTCRGTAVVTSTYRPDRPCDTCSRTGSVTIDPAAIRAALVVSRGRAKGTFRRSRPNGVTEAPEPFVYGAAYVWRLVRFHSGQDMCLPMMAPDYVGVGWLLKDEGKAVIDALDDLAVEVAVELFGARALTGTGRWGKALTGDSSVLLASGSAHDPAYSGNGSDLHSSLRDSPEAVAERLVSAS